MLLHICRPLPVLSSIQEAHQGVPSRPSAIRHPARIRGLAIHQSIKSNKAFAKANQALQISSADRATVARLHRRALRLLWSVATALRYLHLQAVKGFQNTADPLSYRGSD